MRVVMGRISVSDEQPAVESKPLPEQLIELPPLFKREAFVVAE
jgi:hypothetical protein